MDRSKKQSGGTCKNMIHHINVLLNDVFWGVGETKKGCLVLNFNVNDCTLYMHASVGQSILRY